MPYYDLRLLASLKMGEWKSLGFFINLWGAQQDPILHALAILKIRCLVDLLLMHQVDIY